VQEQVSVPAGYTLQWSGQYEYMERAKERLTWVVPLTLAIIFLLLYLTFRSVPQALIVMLSVPFALVGAVWLLWYLEYNLSVAVWVGIIALAGLAAETGVVMIVYLDEAYEEAVAAGRLRTRRDLIDATLHGSVQRVRPKLMTVASTMFGLLPIMWGVGAGSDMIKRIAAPMVGGMVSSTVLTLLVIPAIYVIWRGWGHRKSFRLAATQFEESSDEAS
jgi:Cu(I)/Ag(I) efflux system membrane protein CusA/SilA